MRPQPSWWRYASRWLRHAAFLFAAVSQLVGVYLTVPEGRRGVGAGAHAEAVGTTTHYAHDEASCAACQARASHGRVPASPRFVVVRGAPSAQFGPAGAVPPAAALTSHTDSRAPPRVL